MVQGSIGQTVTGLDFSDDRLESVLDAVGEDASWTAFEAELNQLFKIMHFSPKWGIKRKNLPFGRSGQEKISLLRPI